jgi:hypothetical protein
MAVKIKTTCGVAVPDWYINAENFGTCRKYQPHYNAQQDSYFMLCSDTKLPCPLNGVHQFPVYAVVVPKWMQGDAWQTNNDYVNGKRVKREKTLRSGSKYD